MNPARPAPGAFLARTDDVPDGGAICLYFREGDSVFSMILARRGDALFAYENSCPHMGFPMERFDGSVLVQEGRFIVCTAHGASFTMEDGACVGGPCHRRSLAKLEIDVRDGAVLTSPLRLRPGPDSDRGGGAS